MMYHLLGSLMGWKLISYLVQSLYQLIIVTGLISARDYLTVLILFILIVTMLVICLCGQLNLAMSLLKLIL